MLILNKYKNRLEDLVNSLDIKHLAIPKQIDLPNNNIPNSKDNPNDLKIDNYLSDRSQRHHQRRITPLPILGSKIGDKKVRGGEKKKDKGEHQRGKREVVGRGGRISEVSVY